MGGCSFLSLPVQGQTHVRSFPDLCNMCLSPFAGFLYIWTCQRHAFAPDLVTWGKELRIRHGCDPDLSPVRAGRLEPEGQTSLGKARGRGSGGTGEVPVEMCDFIPALHKPP